MKKVNGNLKPETGNPEQTLAAVRELSENWSHRPAPNKLLCRPLQACVILKPVATWQARRDALLSLITQHSSLAA
jgi:hypothetical protein